MANSEYLAVVNRVLEHAGQVTITSSTDFNNNNIEKVQLQAKRFVDKANRRLIRSHRPRQRLRKFTLSLTSGDNDYTLNATTSLENLKQGSWFITTDGIARGPLKYITYDEWLMRYPAGEDVESIPECWFDYPPDGVTSGDRVGFSPPPNQNMTVQYEGYLDVTALTNATDKVAFDTKFEDIIWDYGQLFLEACLSEGKTAEIGAFLDGMEAELRQLSMGPRDEPPKVNLGIRLPGVSKCTGRYASRWTLGSD